MTNPSKFLAIIIILLTVCLCIPVRAQPPQKFSFGLNGGIANNRYDSYAIGGDMRFLFNVSKRLSIPLTVGYTSIKEKSSVNRFGVKRKGDVHDYFPIKLGVKAFGFYGLLEVGITGVGAVGGSLRIPNVISPAVGYGWNNRVDLAVKYEDYGFDLGFTGLRLGYWF